VTVPDKDARRRGHESCGRSPLCWRVSAILVLAALGAIPSAAAGTGSDSAPGQSAPIASTPPSISGRYVEGRTLTANEGTWRGPARTYTFQWLRCNSAGSMCSPITSASDQEYATTATDIGSTSRVVVIATNKNGSAIATSDATPRIAAALSVQSYTSTSVSTTTTTTTTTTAATTTAPTPTSTSIETTTTPTTTTTPATTTSSAQISAPYFVGNFDTGNLSQWPKLDDAQLSRTPPGVQVVPSPVFGSSFAAKVVALDSPDSSTSGDASFVEEDTYDGLSWQMQGDVWHRFQVLLPSGSNPNFSGSFTVNPGWDMFLEWHNPPCPSGCSGGYGSSYVGVYRDNHLALQVAGGSGASPTLLMAKDSNPLLYDHWYDILVRFVYSDDPHAGWYEWWVDGELISSGYTPTVYRLPDGQIHGNRLSAGHYRRTVAYQDTVYLDGVIVGPTRSSVGG